MPAIKAFCGPSYESIAYRADAEQCINQYPQVVESEGRVTDRILVGIPGLANFASSIFAPIRAGFGQDGRSFAIVGAAFVEISSTGVITNRGTVTNDNLPATISSGGDAAGQLFLVAGGDGFSYNLLTNVLTAVPAAGTGLVQGGYLDGFFWTLDDTSTFHLSDLLDGTSWDPLQIAQRNDASDRWVAGMTIGKFIWLWGSETTSVLYDSGAFPFPFTLQPGVLIARGTGAVFSVQDVDGSPVWLAQSQHGDRMIVRANGFGAPTRVSKHNVEAALNRYATVDDAVSISYEWEGHPFWQINFPTENDAWAVDLSSGEWFKPLFWNAGIGAYECSRAQYHWMAFGEHLIGDRETGTIYRLSATTFTDAGGAPLRRLRRVPFPRLLKVSDYINLQFVQVLADVGIGLESGQGVDPQVMMRISRDGGKTWGNEHWTTAGAMGQYLTRIMYGSGDERGGGRLGRYRDGMGVLEIVVSDPAPFRFTGCEFGARKGAP